MRKVLIDTNVYTAFKNNNESIVTAFRELDLIALDVTVLAELMSGFSLGSKMKQNRRELEQFIDSPRVEIIEHDAITADFYSQIFKILREKGTPIPTNDIWIASIAMQHGLWLFTLDEHFKKVPGIILYLL